MRKKNILVPTEEIVTNCSYILRILINYGILRGGGTGKDSDGGSLSMAAEAMLGVSSGGV